MFKVGDTLKRISGMCNVMPMHWQGVVTEVTISPDDVTSVKFAEYDNWWFADNFILILKPSPKEEPKMKPHKHAEFIKAWADGKTVQFFDKNAKHWTDLSPNGTIGWMLDWEYRIKPEPKPDVVCLETIKYTKNSGACFSIIGQKVEFTFDGETEKIKSIKLLD